MISQVYGRALLALAQSEVALNTDVINASLVNSTYSVDLGAHGFLSDLSIHVVSGTTIPITGVSLAYDATTHQVLARGDDLDWAGPVTARYAVIWHEATQHLLAFIDFETAVVNDSLHLGLAEGWLRLATWISTEAPPVGTDSPTIKVITDSAGGTWTMTATIAGELLISNTSLGTPGPNLFFLSPDGTFWELSVLPDGSIVISDDTFVPEGATIYGGGLDARLILPTPSPTVGYELVVDNDGALSTEEVAL